MVTVRQGRIGIETTGAASLGDGVISVLINSNFFWSFARNYRLHPPLVTVRRVEMTSNFTEDRF
jgi:hypothetical protein